MPPLPWPPKVVSPQIPLFTHRRILLVDTEACDRERYAQNLCNRGFSVRVCPSYQEGEHYLERENYDLVLVDQGGPEFEGRVLIARSVLKDRNVPVLVLTRHHDMTSYVEAMQLGVADYLEKPVAANDFIWAIETHLPASSITAKLAK